MTRKNKLSLQQKQSEGANAQGVPLLQHRSFQPDGFEQGVNQSCSGGSALAPNIHTKMGAAMGANFSRVRVHTDARSDQLSQSIQAKAFTTGQDVFFR